MLRVDKNETCVLSYGLEHSVTPEHIPTDDIVPTPESVLARRRELPLVAKRRCMRGLLSNLAQLLKSKADNDVMSCIGLCKNTLSEIVRIDREAAKGAQVLARVQWVEEG